MRSAPRSRSRRGCADPTGAQGAARLGRLDLARAAARLRGGERAARRRRGASRSSPRAARRSHELDLRGEVVFCLGAEREGLPAAGRARPRRDDPDARRRVAQRRRRRCDRALRVGAPESRVMAGVARINVTPVKGLGLAPSRRGRARRGRRREQPPLLPDLGRAALQRQGPRPARLGRAPRFDGGRLTLRFPDGERARAARSTLGEPVETDFWGRPVAGRVVDGPWSEALSDYAGAAVQLVQTDASGQRRPTSRSGRCSAAPRASAWRASSARRSTRAASACCSSSTASRRTTRTAGAGRRVARRRRRSSSSAARCRAASVTTQDPDTRPRHARHAARHPQLPRAAASGKLDRLRRLLRRRAARARRRRRRGRAALALLPPEKRRGVLSGWGPKVAETQRSWRWLGVA